jgi:hypothetical protein
MLAIDIVENDVEADWVVLQHNLAEIVSRNPERAATTGCRPGRIGKQRQAKPIDNTRRRQSQSCPSSVAGSDRDCRHRRGCH